MSPAPPAPVTLQSSIVRAAGARAATAAFPALVKEHKASAADAAWSSCTPIPGGESSSHWRRRAEAPDLRVTAGCEAAPQRKRRQP
eukprot:scaffold21179_cov68-Isochrysis_galbana.AAC.2